MKKIINKDGKIYTGYGYKGIQLEKGDVVIALNRVRDLHQMFRVIDIRPEFFRGHPVEAEDDSMALNLTISYDDVIAIVNYQGIVCWLNFEKRHRDVHHRMAVEGFLGGCSECLGTISMDPYATV